MLLLQRCRLKETQIESGEKAQGQRANWGTRCGRSAGRNRDLRRTFRPMRPPTYIQYAIRAARLESHPHLTIPPIRPAGGTRSRIIKESAAPALIGCTHQHQFKRRAALEAAESKTLSRFLSRPSSEPEGWSSLVHRSFPGSGPRGLHTRMIDQGGGSSN